MLGMPSTKPLINPCVLLTNGALLVHRLANHVDDTAQGATADGHLQGCSKVRLIDECTMLATPRSQQAHSCSP